MKKILVVNNDDSFIYNLVELLRINGNCCFDVVLSKDLMLTVTDNYDAIILSPGSGLPHHYPKMMQLIDKCASAHSIFGVCLGFQAIAVHFGATLNQLLTPKHGHVSSLRFMETTDPLFAGINKPIMVGRYHSWVVDENSLSKDLIVSSVDQEGNIMSFYHRDLPIFGVQFHPESIMTNYGKTMIDNWINLI